MLKDPATTTASPSCHQNIVTKITGTKKTEYSGQSITLTIIASYPRSLSSPPLEEESKTKQKRREIENQRKQITSERVSTHSQLPKNSKGETSSPPISIPFLSGRKIRKKKKGKP
jgi:hypothetical protein